MRWQAGFLATTAILAPWLFALPASAATQSDALEIHLSVGGFDRSYLLHVPAAARRAGPAPLVIAMHGGGGKAVSVLTRDKWQAASDRYGFVLAAPQALIENGSAWRDLSGRNRIDVDDVAFISAMIDDVAAKTAIDSRRVYATGFSSGASMAQMLGLRLSDRLAAIAPVTGHLWQEEAPRRALPVLMIFGALDPRNPPEGGTAPGTKTQKPRQAANAEIWVRQMNCAPEAAADHPRPEVSRSVWRGCIGDGLVEFWLIQGLGHRWAGGEPSKRSDELLGPYTDVIDATEVIWKFFAAHPQTQVAK